VPDLGRVDDWRFRGPSADFEELCDYLELPGAPARAVRLAARATA
jgi:hypothetical protein